MFFLRKTGDRVLSASPKALLFFSGGLGPTKRCDLTLSSTEAADPRRNSDLETGTVLGKGDYLW